MEEKPIRAQFTTNKSYLRFLRIFKVMQRAVFYFSTKDSTPRNKKKASAQGVLLNRNMTAMPSWGSELCPLPESSKSNSFPWAKERGPWQKLKTPHLGLFLKLHHEPAGGKGPHTLRKWHLQVKHEVVKPFFRNTVMEAHCKRGDGDRH